MPLNKATQTGSLNKIDDCWIRIPSDSGSHTIFMNNLPEISDSKKASYNNEAIIGRSAPLYTYHYSADRNISMQIHLFIVDTNDAETNLEHLRWLESAVYPRKGSQGAPFVPPPICQIRCGDLLAKQSSICAILESYSVKFPTDVAWDVMGGTFCPFRLDIDTNWIVVYTSSDLPYQDRIIQSGY